MKKELDNRLCKDYPELYKDRHGDMTQTCMVWGFDCGDGWYPLIDTLSYLLSHKVKGYERDIAHIQDTISKGVGNSGWAKSYYTQETLEKKQEELKQAKEEVPTAVQVKEKFGTLRFYTNGGSEKEDAYITFAEVMSGNICETCGTTKDVFQTQGRIRTTCKVCSPTDYEEHMSVN